MHGHLPNDGSCAGLNNPRAARGTGDWKVSVVRWTDGHKLWQVNGKSTIMTRQNLHDLLKQGYQILDNGIPRKVEIDLWNYLSGLDGKLLNILVLEELLTWDDPQLAMIEIDAQW